MAACVISMSTVVHCRRTCDLGADQNSSTTLTIFELLFQALICLHVGYLSDTTDILFCQQGFVSEGLFAAGFTLVRIQSGAAAVSSGHRSVLHTCTGAMLMCQQFLRQPPVIQEKRTHIAFKICESVCKSQPCGAFTVQEKCMPGLLVYFCAPGPIEIARSGCFLCCVKTMQVGEQWEGWEFTAA